jgi:serine/threonine protein kinase
MGEVYRARDARLDRTIAVKVLPAELAVDEVYRQRFEREARAASALNHPHIAHVYDVGVDEGTHFIAMEYVEGENLRELISRGPLAVERIVDLGQQMASALEEAHSRGIVHRDIKSANAVVSPNGQVKLLDFGLARKTLESPAALDSRVETEARTQAGLVVGTVPYMSPEQALTPPPNPSRSRAKTCRPSSSASSGSASRRSATAVTPPPATSSSTCGTCSGTGRRERGRGRLPGR